jgi:pyrimidine-nucleoside phosphorylase
LNISDIISRKQKGFSAPKYELEPFINNYVQGHVSDEEMTNWLKAVFEHGMEPEELNGFIEIMVNSGKRLDFSHLNTFVADKHSTGGVGDKISLILAPLLAAAGMAIPMISGRALGHTGGTLDKLESIPGFSTQLSLTQFQNQVEKIGLSMIGQTDEICPADKKMYALRDATGTVESFPLIVGSIMSKKIAEGLNGLVLDVKTGNGAFMKTHNDAKKLGTLLKEAGENSGIQTDVIFSNMNQPLGRFSGCWCEVTEAIECLNGIGPEDTVELTLELASKLMVQGKLAQTPAEGKSRVRKLLTNGSAFEKFIEMVGVQGGDSHSLLNPDKIHVPSEEIIIKANKSGFVEYMDTYSIGIACAIAGCGYMKSNDVIDPTAGLECYVKVGSELKEGDPMFRIFNSNKSKLTEAENKLKNVAKIGESHKTEQLILDSL